MAQENSINFSQIQSEQSKLYSISKEQKHHQEHPSQNYEILQPQSSHSQQYSVIIEKEVINENRLDQSIYHIEQNNSELQLNNRQGARDNPAGDSSSLYYKEMLPVFAHQIKKNVSSPQQLEQIKQNLRQKIKQKKKKLAQQSQQARPNIERPQKIFATKSDLEEVNTKYLKYKELYRQELVTSKKLRGELRKIYDKVSKLQWT